MRQCLQRCPECPSRKLPENEQKNPVAGDGPSDADVMFVGEAPGREENNRGRPFLGKAGEELNITYLMRSGLIRDDVYVTNTNKCHWADSSDAPPEKVYRSCAEFHLRRELREINPRFVVLMGGIANSLLDLDVDMEHGIMRPNVELLGWRGNVYSTFHPALGLHMSSKMQALLDDFILLKEYIKGGLAAKGSMCPEPRYQDLTRASEVDEAISIADDKSTVAIDTESIKRWKGFKGTHVYTPDRLTFCVEPPYAFMIMRKDVGAIQRFASRLRKFRKIYMHNMPHDDWALSQMNVYTPTDRVYDTMSGAYHDGRLAKGLKSLSWRLARIRMTSFDDVVVPYSYEKAIEYLAEAATMDLPLPDQYKTGEMVTRNCPDCKGKGVMWVGRGNTRSGYDCDCDNGKVTVPGMTKHQSLNQAISRVFTDIKKGDVKIWERWEAWTDKPHIVPAVKALIAKLGPLPVPSIDYVPHERARVYACGDALSTRIIGPIIETRVSQIRRMVR